MPSDSGTLEHLVGAQRSYFSILNTNLHKEAAEKLLDGDEQVH